MILESLGDAGIKMRRKTEGKKVSKCLSRRFAGTYSRRIKGTTRTDLCLCAEVGLHVNDKLFRASRSKTCRHSGTMALELNSKVTETHGNFVQSVMYGIAVLAPSNTGVFVITTKALHTPKEKREVFAGLIALKSFGFPFVSLKCLTVVTQKMIAPSL